MPATGEKPAGRLPGRTEHQRRLQRQLRRDERHAAVGGRSMPRARAQMVRVTTSLLKISPYHSVVNFSALRVGNCAPIPKRIPLDRSYSSGSPRCRYPMVPETSAMLATSLLTMKSNAKSIFPVPEPASAEPVGSFSMPRTATATGD